mmetsp:Transcript_16914/g.34424  ORF Transcript_16914/g.34424 Transcript_16914/m.34424 type:complete len:218 (+) Transcript_16914:68-721(+)
MSDCTLQGTVSFGTVNLNVGGHHYSTTRETLVLRAPESMLAAMFSGRHHQPLDKNGSIFIDRDGQRFRHILNYLRTGSVPSFDASWRYEELMEEADYFALDELRALVEGKVEEFQRQRDELEKQQRAADCKPLSVTVLQHQPPTTPAPHLMGSNPRMAIDPATVPSNGGSEENGARMNFSGGPSLGGDDRVTTPRGGILSNSPSLSPNLNFALNMDF